MGWDDGEPSQGFHAREPGHTSLDPQLQLRPQMGAKGLEEGWVVLEYC